MTYNIKEFFGLNKKEVINYKKEIADLTKNLVSPTKEDDEAWIQEK
jgi:hypothetical protein